MGKNNKKKGGAKGASAATATNPDTCKNMGNECYMKGDFPEAVEWYSRAIELDQNNQIYFSNRKSLLSTCFDSRLMLWQKHLLTNVVLTFFFPCRCLSIHYDGVV